MSNPGISSGSRVDTLPRAVTARRAARWIGCMIGLAALSVMFSLNVGSVDLSWAALLDKSASEYELTRAILLDVRLPRVLSAFLTGGLLALAGLLMQVLLRNPLADPYILGVSGGAGLGGVLMATVLPASLAAWGLPLGAGLGAGAVIVLVFGVASSRPFMTMERLILVGVAVSSLCSAMVSLLLNFSDDGVLKGVLFWLLGELTSQYWPLLMTALIACLLVSLRFARAMNVLILGEDLAQTMGVSVRTLRWVLYWTAALATGVAVTAGGMIGFVGLVVPHALRLLLGNDLRLLMPSAVLAGGAFLTLADCIARTLVAPIQLPVGVVTALLGAPVFIGMLLRGLERGRRL